jgi:hypothetical protein
MPMVIQRTATVYRLWDHNDFAALFDDHANAGWLCTLTAQKPADVVVKQVALQNTQTRQLVNAQLTDVVVSDLVTVEAQTVAEYNVAHPDNAIEVS